MPMFQSSEAESLNRSTIAHRPPLFFAPFFFLVISNKNSGAEWQWSTQEMSNFPILWKLADD